MKRSLWFLPIYLALPMTLWGWVVTPDNLVIDPAQPQAFLTLYSEKGDSTLAISVHPFHRVIDDWGKETMEVSQKEFFIYPSHIFLQPHEKKTIRLIWRGNPSPDEELAYRVVIESMPVKKAVMINGAEGKDVSATINVGTRYVQAVYIQPKGLISKVECKSVSVEPNGTLLVELKNIGKQHELLRGFPLKIQTKEKEIQLTNVEVAKAANEWLNILPGHTRFVRIPVPETLMGQVCENDYAWNTSQNGYNLSVITETAIVQNTPSSLSEQTISETLSLPTTINPLQSDVPSDLTIAPLETIEASLESELNKDSTEEILDLAKAKLSSEDSLNQSLSQDLTSKDLVANDPLEMKDENLTASQELPMDPLPSDKALGSSPTSEATISTHELNQTSGFEQETVSALPHDPSKDEVANLDKVTQVSSEERINLERNDTSIDPIEHSQNPPSHETVILSTDNFLEQSTLPEQDLVSDSTSELSKKSENEPISLSELKEDESADQSFNRSFTEAIKEFFAKLHQFLMSFF